MIDKTIDYFGIRAAAGETVGPREKTRARVLGKGERAPTLDEVPGWGALFRLKAPFSDIIYTSEEEKVKKRICQIISSSFTKFGFRRDGSSTQEILGVSFIEFLVGFWI